jgi:hypothetical protein
MTETDVLNMSNSKQTKLKENPFASVNIVGLPYFFGSNSGHIFEIT